MNQPAGFERFGHAVRAMVDAALSQWHWAFYRSTFVALLPILSATAGSASCPVLERIFEQPFYWGCWLGMAAAALEWSLNPYARAALHGPGRQSAEIRSLVLAVATTAIFSATRNFWVCVGCHAVTEAALTFWFPPVSEPAAA